MTVPEPTPPAPRPVSRRRGRPVGGFGARLAVTSLAALLALVSLAGPASAEVPEGWSDPEPVPVLHALLVLAGIPLLLFVLIVAAVYLSRVRGQGAATHELVPLSPRDQA